MHGTGNAGQIAHVQEITGEDNFMGVYLAQWLKGWIWVSAGHLLVCAAAETYLLHSFVVAFSLRVSLYQLFLTAQASSHWSLVTN